MADYKEQTVEGKAWQRAFHIDGRNELSSPRGLTYHEETAIQLNGQVVTSRSGQTLDCPYDPSGVGDTFPLINPLDGSTIGTMTEQALYVALSSHYLHKAQARDAAQAAVLSSMQAAAAGTNP